MLVSLAEYGKLHDRSPDTLRRLAEKGAFSTAQKQVLRSTFEANPSTSSSDEHAPS